MKVPCTVRIRQNRKIIPLEYLFASLQAHQSEIEEEELVYSDREEPFIQRQWEKEESFYAEDEEDQEEAPSSTQTEIYARGIYSQEKDGSHRISYESGDGEVCILNTFCLAPTAIWSPPFPMVKRREIFFSAM